MYIQRPSGGAVCRYDMTFHLLVKVCIFRDHLAVQFVDMIWRFTYWLKYVNSETTWRCSLSIWYEVSLTSESMYIQRPSGSAICPYDMKFHLLVKLCSFRDHLAVQFVDMIWSFTYWWKYVYSETTCRCSLSIWYEVSLTGESMYITFRSEMTHTSHCNTVTVMAPFVLGNTNSVGTKTRCVIGCPRVFLHLWREELLIVHATHDRSWVVPSLLYSGHQASFPELRRPSPEADLHLAPLLDISITIYSLPLCVSIGMFP